METLNRIETAIEYIRTRGNATTQELAEALGYPKRNVQPMLYLAISMGYLSTSKQAGANIYRISEDVPEGMSWADYKVSKRVPKAPAERVKPSPKAKVIVEKPERTPAEVRNTLADLFERRALGLPPPEDDEPSGDAPMESVDAAVQALLSADEATEQAYPQPAPQSVSRLGADKGTLKIQVDATDAIAEINRLREMLSGYVSERSAAVGKASLPSDVRFLFGCDGRLQVNLGDRRIICTREETAAVGRMMSALEPVWNV